MGDGIYVHKNGFNNDNRRNNLVSIRGYKNDGKTYLNGYIAVYSPEHPRAFDNGCVYEHVLVAEKMLERPLTDEECVHHKDFDRTNNDENNLMIFATEADHISYHNGRNAILKENGIYVCEKYDKIEYKYINRTKREIENGEKDIGSIIIIKNGCKYNFCPICKENIKTIEAKYCLECWRRIQSKNIPTKEELEKLIKEMSFVKIGELYNVSDRAVRKWCDKYNLPSKRKGFKQAV